MYISSNSFCKPYIMQCFLFTCLNTNINIQTLLLAYYYHLFLTNHKTHTFQLLDLSQLFFITLPLYKAFHYVLREYTNLL